MSTEEVKIKQERKDEETEVKRPDGRQRNHIRAPELDIGLLSRADGSVRFSQGRTAVLVSVNGPLPVRQQKEEKIERAVIEVVFKSASGQATHFDVDKGELIRQTLETVVLTTLHPATKITVVVQVVRDDGSLLATALNGAWLALLDSGIQCRSMMACGEGPLLLDPELEEEKVADCLITLAFDTKQPPDPFAAAAPPSDDSPAILLSETRGLPSRYMESVSIASKAAASVLTAFRSALCKRFAVPPAR